MLYIMTLGGFMPEIAFAMNREPSVQFDQGRGDIRELESETQLERDLMGRKLVVDPNSQINQGSLQVELAPGSTVIIRARQENKGLQTTRTHRYRNVEVPN